MQAGFGLLVGTVISDNKPTRRSAARGAPPLACSRAGLFLAAEWALLAAPVDSCGRKGTFVVSRTSCNQKINGLLSPTCFFFTIYRLASLELWVVLYLDMAGLENHVHDFSCL